MFRKDKRQSPKKWFKDNEDSVLEGQRQPLNFMSKGGVWAVFQRRMKEMTEDGDNQMLQKHPCIWTFISRIGDTTPSSSPTSSNQGAVQLHDVHQCVVVAWSVLRGTFVLSWWRGGATMKTEGSTGFLRCSGCVFCPHTKSILNGCSNPFCTLVYL